jgi:DNA-binding CsgD family transcriptional regulator
MLIEAYQNSKKESITAISFRLLKLKEELMQKMDDKEDFTPREHEIINLIARGLNSSEIGEKLFISKHTVDTHRKNIHRKGNFKCLRDVLLYSLLL